MPSKRMQKHRHPGRNCTALMDRWRVLDRHCRYSKGQYTPSDYSACKCMKCNTVWRTKADYVALLADAMPKERFA